MKRYIFILNLGLSNQISQIKQKITEILSNYEDKDLFSLINSKMPSFYINQNITQNKVILQLKIQNVTFLDILDYTTAGFLIMSSKYEYLFHKVYIINNVNLNNIKMLKSSCPLIHIKSKEQLSQFQIYFYYLILNYQNFIQRLDIISIRLLIQTSKLSSIYYEIYIYFYSFKFYFLFINAFAIIFIYF